MSLPKFPIAHSILMCKSKKVENTFLKCIPIVSIFQFLKRTKLQCFQILICLFAPYDHFVIVNKMLSFSLKLTPVINAFFAFSIASISESASETQTICKFKPV